MLFSIENDDQETFVNIKRNATRYTSLYQMIETDENIPKTKRKYFNPKNGKLVAYSRYCQIMKELGLID